MALMIAEAEREHRVQLAILTYLLSRGDSAEDPKMKLSVLDELLDHLRERQQHLQAGGMEH
ncbi:hypothetical protein [Methylobacterium nigriterrae]|uniref:hypothetical protein n=1 Tax=Methylobacterium nigriterrae TaxID=3127512 RepID=UPI0030139F2A